MVATAKLQRRQIFCPKSRMTRACSSGCREPLPTVTKLEEEAAPEEAAAGGCDAEGRAVSARRRLDGRACVRPRLGALADAAAGVVHLEGRAPPVAARHHPLRVWRRRVHRRRARGRRPVPSLNPLAHDAQVALAIQRPFEGVEDSRHLERHLAAFRQDAVEQRLHRLDVGRRQADDRQLQR